MKIQLCIEGCGSIVHEVPPGSRSYFPQCRDCARKKRHAIARLAYKRRRKPRNPSSRMQAS